MKKLLIFPILAACLGGCTDQTAYEIASSNLLTPFAEHVDPATPLPEYPRPQMKREQWMNLNGSWDYALGKVGFEPLQGLTTQDSWTNGEIPGDWEGQILVPFAIDAPLSGVGHILRHNEILWYNRTFRIPASWKGQRVLLHFQASDWETSVYINGKKLGQHRGGYDPFTFDITDQLVKGENRLNVCVWDATENQAQAIGKQIMPENRQGYRFQPTGGIWQTVWLEPVPANAIQSLRITPDYDQSEVKLEVTAPAKDATLKVKVFDGSQQISGGQGIPGDVINIPVENFIAWSPDNPHLYTLEITMEKEGRIMDQVQSYFGMRKLEVRTADDGFRRIFLNDEPVFQYGPLDQGYWPDGVLTPPTEEAIKYDLEYLKRIGCNMVRVHIKTHPDRWYYWADKLGLMVWQDMICMPKYGQTVDSLAANQWFQELKAMSGWLYNHPSVVSWVIFNEGWSQHNTGFYTRWITEYDPDRIINPASGWDDRPMGDVMDVHDYTFYPRNNAADFKTDGQRALVIGEAAGINLAIPGHTWYSEQHPPAEITNRYTTYIPKDEYSFQIEAGRHFYATPQVFEEAYRKFIETNRLLIAATGNNALVYTQITDVEHELNGYLTYDRRVSKIDPEVMREITMTLYDPPEIQVIIPYGAAWQVGTGEDDTGSITLPLGDNNEFIPVKTRMAPPYVIENVFQVEDLDSKLAIAVRGFTDCEIRLNGQLFRKTRLSARFGEPGINIYPVFKEEMRMVQKGENTISILVEETPDVDLLDAAVYRYRNN